MLLFSLYKHSPETSELLNYHHFKLEQNLFPNGEFRLELEDRLFDVVKKDDLNDSNTEVNIEWYYKDNSEFLALNFLVSNLKEVFPNAKFKLDIPYFPYARMDRTKNLTDFFTLKYIIEAIIKLGFDHISTVDAHSSKVEELFREHGVNFTNKSAIEWHLEDVLEEVNGDPVAIVFPDETAKKRFSAIQFEEGNEDFHTIDSSGGR